MRYRSWGVHFFNSEGKQHSLSVLNLIVWDFTFVLTHVLDRADGRREEVRVGGLGRRERDRNRDIQTGRQTELLVRFASVTPHCL